MGTPLPRNEAAFTVSEILAATGGALAARGASERVDCVSTNTREMARGAVFVALRGEAHDGHDYVAAAAASGALAAVVERDVVAPPAMTIVRAGSTTRALADLARAHTRRWRGRGGRTLVGITGSAGKTTTRVAVAALATRLFPGQVVATRGNLNNRIGVPMMLFSLGPAHRVAVLELGTSEPGEIAELCRVAQPDVGVLTLIAAAHLEGLGTIEGVAFEKRALFRSLGDAGIAVGNADDQRVRRALAEAPAFRRAGYGRSIDTEVRLLDRAPLTMTRSRLILGRAGGDIVELETPLAGEAGALACAAAVAVVETTFDARLTGAQLTEAFDEVDASEGAARLVALELASGLAILDDTYNANPASMVASIRAATEMAQVLRRPLVLVLGEMHELGEEAASGHEAVGRAAGESGARVVIAFGGGDAERVCDEARRLGAEARLFPSLEEVLGSLAVLVDPGDLVLVKGSRASRADRVVAVLSRLHGAPRPRIG